MSRRIEIPPREGSVVQSYGEIVEVVRALLNYIRDKGQIPSATGFALIEAFAEHLSRHEGTKRLGEVLARIPSRVLQLSVHEPRYHETVWQYALKVVAEGLVTRIEMVEQQQKKTKVVRA